MTAGAPILAGSPRLLRVESRVPDHYPKLIRRRSFFGASNYFSHELREAVLMPGVGEEALTDFGYNLKRGSVGRDFVDLGCGKPEKSPVPRYIAQLLGCRSYIGVDEGNVDDHVLSERLADGRNFQTQFLRSDILDFLSHFPVFGAIFYLSGIEPINLPNRQDLNERVSKAQINRDYIAAVLTEILHLCRDKGLLLLGPATAAFEPQESLFDPIARENKHRLYVAKNF